MALAENHRNALKMEAAAVSANNNNSNITLGSGSANSTAAPLFVGNGGLSNSANPTPLLQHHQQQNHPHHNRLTVHHPSIESPHSLIEDELGKLTDCKYKREIIPKNSIAVN